MPQLRKDPVSNTWVVIAQERARRPSDFAASKSSDANSQETCPFCEGREGQTPAEAYALRNQGSPNGPGWDVRVVPNKFSALAPDGNLNHQSGFAEQMNAVGAHEVIVESPDHLLTLADMPVAQVQKVAQVYAARILTLYQDKNCVYAQLFKNDGKEAGASLSHPHSQLIGLPLLPGTIETEMSNALAYYVQEQQSVFEQTVNLALEAPRRVVDQNEHFVALTPYASRFPFEVHLMPRFDSHDFTRMDNAQIASFSQLLKTTLKRINTLLSNPPYNFYLHTAPNPRAMSLDDRLCKAYRWHIEIVPRLSKTAGFELGSGIFINPTPPEMAAELLRGQPQEDQSRGTA